MNFHHDGVTLLRDQSAALRTLECVLIQTFSYQEQPGSIVSCSPREKVQKVKKHPLKSEKIGLVFDLLLIVRWHKYVSTLNIWDGLIYWSVIFQNVTSAELLKCPQTTILRLSLTILTVNIWDRLIYWSVISQKVTSAELSKCPQTTILRLPNSFFLWNYMKLLHHAGVSCYVKCTFFGGCYVIYPFLPILPREALFILSSPDKREKPLAACGQK